MKKISLLTCIVLLFAISMFAGVEWASVITITDNEKGDSQVMTSHVYAQGGDVKQVFTGVPKKQRDRYIEDGYWLYKGEEESFYIINDKKKTITPLSLDSLQQLGSIAGGIIKIKIEDHKAETQWLKNERVLGRNCRHFKIISDYTMRIKIALIKKTVIVHQEREIWASTAIKGMKGIAQSFLRKDFKTGFPELDKLIEAETQRLKTVGVPLKSIIHAVRKNKKGKVTGDTTTKMEVTSIQSKKLDAAIFELPLGYKTEEVE